jgi:hypothetical protein
MKLRHAILLGILVVFPGTELAARPAPLLAPAVVAALANEVSGETAKRNLEGLAQLHRQRGSTGFHSAAALVADRARAYGLSDVQILQFPADGKTRYGTQLARQAWDAVDAQLTEVRGGRETTLARFDAQPTVLAEDSESADVTTELVDAGTGLTTGEYRNKTVRGKIVLVSSQGGDVEDLAVGKYGAAGIVSYAQNQSTAWSGDNDSLIRWGHLDSFSPLNTFAFMVSLRTARELQARLLHGEAIRLHAHVNAGRHPGSYEIVTATIPGADPRLKDEEIAFSCHLDHQRPGANDNASGCAGILEAARTLQTLIGNGQLPRPMRTIRFIWPPEIEGTLALLNARPDFARRIKAVVHMDMVGGGPETKAVFHVTRGPMSLPSFVHDVGWAFATWVNDESYRFAATGRADYPLTAPEGGKEPLRAEYSPYRMGSDHDVYQDSSFGIPAIYMNDWPDRYIHTNLDAASNIDPTKLKRAVFIGAASGYFLANFSAQDRVATIRAVATGRMLRSVGYGAVGGPSAPAEEYERGVLHSLDAFDGPRVDAPIDASPATAAHRAAIYRRRAEPRGPLVAVGYDYFADRAKSLGIATPRLLEFDGDSGAGPEYAYEALNFANGTRDALQIRDALSAEYGPVPVELVVEYLEALKRVGIVE